MRSACLHEGRDLTSRVSVGRECPYIIDLGLLQLTALARGRKGGCDGNRSACSVKF